MGAEDRLAELKLELPPCAEAGGNLRDGYAGRRLALCLRAMGRSAPTGR